MYARKRIRAGQGSALQGQFDWTITMGGTEISLLKRDTKARPTARCLLSLELWLSPH